MNGQQIQVRYRNLYETPNEPYRTRQLRDNGLDEILVIETPGPNWKPWISCEMIGIVFPK